MPTFPPSALTELRRRFPNWTITREPDGTWCADYRYKTMSRTLFANTPAELWEKIEDAEGEA